MDGGKVVARVLPVLLLALPVPGQEPGAVQEPGPGSRPNVLFLLADDQRADTIGALGNPRIRTPGLDSLARAGFSFTQAYCMGSNSGAVCAPSRAMILSGRHLWRFWTSPSRPRDQCVLMPEHFRRHGYHAFATGKWHNGREWFARCFDDGGAIFFGGMGDHVGLPVWDFDPSGEYPADATHGALPFSTTAFADQAVAFLRSREAGAPPFFLFVSFTAPHDPRTPPDRFRIPSGDPGLPLPPNFLPEHTFDNGELRIRDEQLAPFPRTPEAVREHLADYYGMIQHLDMEVGRILGALRERGELDRTLIVYASDQGLAVGSHGLMGKQNLYEHSMRTALILRGPGVPRNRRSGALCYLFDLFPTLCDLAGLPVPAGVDGRSLAPVIRGERTEHRDRIFTAYKDAQRALRTSRWKLIRYPRIGRFQLFDLETDPFETNDLIGEEAHAWRAAWLAELLAAEQARYGDPIGP